MDDPAVMAEREVTGLVVARVGRVEATSAATLPWVVLDGAGRAITPVSEFLRELLACGSTPASCRSYAFDLLRWFRFLTAVDVEWSRAKRVDVRDFVLWLRTCHNPARDRRRPGAPAPGSLNARTGKPYLRSGYAPATINHAVSVLAAFYDHHLQTGQGPVVSPVPPQSRDGRQLEAHHNPLEPFLLHRRGAYRQKQADREPRAVPDDVVEDLFTSLGCHRDRALFSMFLSSGARAAEMLGMTIGDVRPGEGRIYVQTKGRSGTKEACPASPEAFAWLPLCGRSQRLATDPARGPGPGPAHPAELIDRHPITNRAVRDVFVHYLAERSAVLDYGSLANHAQMLADLFWGDLQRHHPAISSLNLPDEVAHAWKQRVRVLPDGRPRRTAHAVFLAVRSFYLDLSQWSMEDPARWAAWAAPCPISEADIRGYIKEARHRQARMQQRTRPLVPVLPQLVRAAEARLQHATLLLQAARSAEPGEEFTAEGARYRRTGRNGSHWRPTALFLAPVDEPGPRFDAECEENKAFWTWASIEVLRRTGARIEELLEFTHLSLRQYQAPTGETVPLLQISPSKTDRERVIPADPDLVAVLARIIRRIKGTGERVPLLTRYDGYERVFGPPMPHLFQCPSQHRLQVISPNRIRELLTDHALRAGIVDVDGTPLRFTPHDFRRIFSTETVNGGLPIHIAAKLLGHLDLNTTQAYVAVYPEEVIRHYRQFVDQCRTHRPSEEYREPSDTEWQDFRDHFSLRKVALGTCDRPYGTPCQHEHACVRCPMLRLDLAQEPRLLEIEANTRQRLGEAQRMQWLGEVAGLQESLRHIADKKQQAERLRAQTDRGEDGVAALG